MSGFPTDLVQQIKAAAEADFPNLVEAAGFRRSRLRRKYHCYGHQDKTPSAHLYEDRVHCFSCDSSWDAIDLEQVAGGGTTGEAIVRLAQRYCLKTGGPTQVSRPRITREILAESHLFHVGLQWYVDRELDSAKEPFWEGLAFDAQKIYELTQRSTAISNWTAFKAAEEFLAMRQVQDDFVAVRVAEALEAFGMFALVFGCATPDSEKAAA